MRISTTYNGTNKSNSDVFTLIDVIYTNIIVQIKLFAQKSAMSVLAIIAWCSPTEDYSQMELLLGTIL